MDERRVPDVARQQRLLDQTRGEFLSEVIRMEAILDAILCDYLDMPLDRQALFRTVCLSEVGLRGKINALAQILEEEGLQHRFPSLVSALNEILTARNLLAHARGPGFGFYGIPDDGDTLGFDRIRGGRRKQIRLSRRRLDEATSEAGAALSELANETWRRPRHDAEGT